MHLRNSFELKTGGVSEQPRRSSRNNWLLLLTILMLAIAIVELLHHW